MKKGDIYYVERNYIEEGSEQRAGRPAIIVSNNTCNEVSPTIEVVYLTTKPKTDLPTHVDIRSAPKSSVALCEQITTVFKDRIGDYMGHCTDYEMILIDAALAISLGLEYSMDRAKSNAKELKKPTVAVPVAPVQTTQLAEPIDKAKHDAEIIKLTTERDIYKNLYDSLINKMTGG